MEEKGIIDAWKDFSPSLNDLKAALDKVEKGIIGAWRDFSREPTFATRAMVDVVGAKVFKSFNPEYKRFELDLEELKKTHPDVHNLAMGTAMLFVLAFSAFCGVAYLMAALIFP